MRRRARRESRPIGRRPGRETPSPRPAKQWVAGVCGEAHDLAGRDGEGRSDARPGRCQRPARPRPAKLVKRAAKAVRPCWASGSDRARRSGHRGGQQGRRSRIQRRGRARWPIPTASAKATAAALPTDDDAASRGGRVGPRRSARRGERPAPGDRRGSADRACRRRSSRKRSPQTRTCRRDGGSVPAPAREGLLPILCVEVRGLEPLTSTLRT